MAYDREGWREAIWLGLFVNSHYFLWLGSKDRLITRLPVSSSPWFAVVSEALTFAVLFKSFAFKFSVKARNSLCTKEHVTVCVLEGIIYFIRRCECWICGWQWWPQHHLWIFRFHPRWNSQGRSPFVEKYFCTFPLACRYHWEASSGYVRLPLIAPGPLSLYIETSHV